VSRSKKGVPNVTVKSFLENIKIANINIKIFILIASTFYESISILGFPESSLDSTSIHSTQ
jgi:hypothetical protein